MVAGENWQESGMVITSSIGTGVYQANNRDYFYRFLLKHGIRQIRVHDMRHSFGTIALEGEAPIEAVSQAMGHSDIGITKKIYAPNVQGLSERALKAFEGLVMPGVEVILPVSQPSEEITQMPLEIIKPVPLSQRPNRAQIDYRAKQKSNG